MSFISKVTAKLAQRYKVGDLVTMTDDALDNYGEKYKDKEFKIVSVSRNEKEHPGFDSGAGCALYDFKDLNFSLYDWELN